MDDYLLSRRAVIAPVHGAWISERCGEGQAPWWSARILVDTIHDGHLVPQALAERPTAKEYMTSDEFLVRAFAQERDWGANLLAGQLAARIGLQEYHRVPVARSVVDIGRHAGVSEGGADHMSRRAVSRDLRERLGDDVVRSLLGNYYHPVWQALVARIEHRAGFGGSSMRLPPLVRIAVHTFDQYGSDGLRPSVSVLSIPMRFADCEVASTTDPGLADCILSAVEAAGIDSTLNEPYRLPDGSLEVRLIRHLVSRHPMDFEGSWRPFSTLALEVRKDLLCDYGPQGEPCGLRTQNAGEIAAVVASGVESYYRAWSKKSR